MNDLTIVQNSNVEIVSYPIFSKLYTTVYNSQNRNNFLISGNILVEHAELNKIDYLHNLYNDLLIVPTGVQYLSFEDPAVLQICATLWGDGNGVAATQLSNVTNLNHIFSGNTNIVKFNELQYFTRIQSLGATSYNGPEGEFQGCTNLEEVYIPSLITSIGKQAFNGCSKLKLINGGQHVFPNITYFGQAAFLNCSSLEGEFSFPDFTGESLNPGNATGRAFSNCTKITKLSFGKATSVAVSNPYGNWYNYPFSGLSGLKVIDFGSSITTYGSYVFNSCGNIKAIIFRGTTPPTVSFASNNVTWGNATSIIYVPTSAYATYQATSGFDTLYNAGRLKTLDEYDEDTILAS